MSAFTFVVGVDLSVSVPELSYLHYLLSKKQGKSFVEKLGAQQCLGFSLFETTTIKIPKLFIEDFYRIFHLFIIQNWTHL